MKKRIKKQYIKLGILGLTLILLFTSCSSTPSSSGYSGYNLVESATIRENQELMTLKATRINEFSKMYADGLNLEDVDDIREEFKKKYDEYLNELFSNVGLPVTFTSDVEFYVLGLKQAKEGSIIFEDVIERPGIYIRNVNLVVSGFQEDSFFKRNKAKKLYKVLKKIWINNYEEDVVSTEITWTTYDESILEEETIETIQNEDNQILYLEKYKKCLSRNIFTKYGLDSYKKRLGTTQSELDILAEAAKVKYSEEFIGIIDLKEEGPSMVAPLKDYSMAFETDGEGFDKYITLIAQKNLYELVEQILIDEGLEDDVVAVVIAKDYDERQTLNQIIEKPMDLPLLKIITNDFYGNFDVTFHYINIKGKEIDYSKLQKTNARIQKLRELRNDKLPDVLINFFTFFYEVKTEEEKKMIVTASENKFLSDRYFRGSYGMGDLYSGLYITKNESESYLAAAIFTKRLDFILDGSLDLSNWDVVEYVYKSRRKNVYDLLGEY